VTTDDAQVWQDRVLRAAGGQPTESTSARLARVERERNDAVRRCADLEQVREELKQFRARADGYAEDIQELEGVRDRLVDEKRALRAENDVLGRLVADATALFERRPGAHTPTTEEKSMTMAVYISIGNSDDKLTQNEWSSFYAATDLVVRRGAHQVHGAWVSPATDPWQNACWCIETMPDPASVEHLKMRLAETAATFRQDSIAWAEAPKTEFLGSSGA
jgi:hypothetical protein